MTYSHIAVNNLAGVGSTGYSVSGSGDVWTALVLPSARKSALGPSPIVIDYFNPVVGGGGTAAVYVEHADRSGRVGSYAFSNAGAANWRGAQSLTGNGFIVADRDKVSQVRLGINTSGSKTLGVNSMPGNLIGADWGTAFNDFTLAGIVGYSVVPNAPRSVQGVQLTPSTMRVDWVAPLDDGGRPITGYVIHASKSATFASGVKTLNVGNVRSATLTGLTAGIWYVRITALNSVSLAIYTGGPWSATATAVLMAEVGDLDGWRQHGSNQAGIATLTTEGVRRAPLAVPGAPSAIYRETVALSLSQLTAGNTGMRRTVTGLTPGKSYQLTARAALSEATKVKTYQLQVIGEGVGEVVTLPEPLTGVDMPPVEFIASASAHDIALVLAAPFTILAGEVAERVAIYDVRLTEVPSNSPYRLASTVMETSLAKHFDIACNSVGARWWVDAAGVTQFSADLGTGSPVATFTDRRAPGKLEYVDIGLVYDTRSIVNDIVLNQHGARPDLDEPGAYLADDYSVNYKDITSLATWGPRSADIEVTLYDDDAYEGAVLMRAVDLVEERADPQLTIRSIRWNAQESPYLAAQLDIHSLVTVEYEGMLQASRVVNIKHDATPNRWMVNLELAPIAQG